eukprot:157664_1
MGDALPVVDLGFSTRNPTSSPTSPYPTTFLTPTSLPSVHRYPTVSTITVPYSNYTISILFDCEPEDVVHACDINKTTITRQITAILVAYIDYNTAILSTDTINNEVVIILSIET